MVSAEGSSFLGEGLFDTGELGTLAAVLLVLLGRSVGGPDLEVNGSPLGNGAAFLVLETGKGGGTVSSIEVPGIDMLSTRVGSDLPLSVASTPMADE